MSDLFAVKFSYLIPLLPLAGALVSGFFGAKWLKQRSHWPIWLGVGVSAAISISLLVGMLRLHPAPGAELFTVKHWFTWIDAGAGNLHFVADAGFLFDPLTAVMLCVVTGIGFFICVYAAGYMKGEAGYF